MSWPIDHPYHPFNEARGQYGKELTAYLSERDKAFEEMKVELKSMIIEQAYEIDLLRDRISKLEAGANDDAEISEGR